MRARRALRASISRRAADERGVLTTELALIMFPWIFGCVALVTFAGRIAQAEGDVQSAAQEAARAATLTGDSGTAVSVANDVAAENLATARIACAGGSNVSVDISDFAPGGYVTVTVTCIANFGDVVYLNVPGSRTFTSTATEIIDVYRSENP